MITGNRVNLLADPGTFESFDNQEQAGFFIGRIRISKRPAYVLATDVDHGLCMPPFDAFARLSLFLRNVHSCPLPLVQILDLPLEMQESSGKTLVPPGGLQLLAHDQGMGRLYAELGRLTGLVPRISVLFGCMGASRSFPGVLCDATVMLKDAALCLGRPDAVARMIGEKTAFQELGGAQVHASISGSAHQVCSTEAEALGWVRKWLGFLPSRAGEDLPVEISVTPGKNISDVQKQIIHDLNSAFDMHELIYALVDGGSWLEMGREHAGECITGLCRFKGVPAGIVANNAMVCGGILFPRTCRKMTRFIEFCSAFGLPVVFLADTPGFMVGSEVEHDGIVRESADLFTAISRSRSARLCIVVRKAYSAGLYAMAGPGFGSRFWTMPGASVSIFGPEALRRFRQGQAGSSCGLEAMDEMLQAALDPTVLADQGLVEQIPEWEQLRGHIAGFAREAVRNGAAGFNGLPH